MKFSKSDFTKDELDVLFYALHRYRSSQFDTLKSFLDAEKITGYSNSRFLDDLRLQINICDSLKSALVDRMLSHSGSDENPE